MSEHNPHNPEEDLEQPNTAETQESVPQNRIGRFRFQYGLRTFLALMAIIGVAIEFWEKPYAQRCREEDNIRRIITNLGGTARDTEHGSGEAFRFMKIPAVRNKFGINDQRIETISLFRHGFDRGEMTDEEIAQIPFEKLRHLCFLRLNDTDASSIDFLHDLPCIDTLEGLSLGNTNITDEDLFGMPHMESLRDIGLGGTAITDNGLNALAKTPNLRDITLENSNITGVGIDLLHTHTPNLESLQLNNTKLSDEDAQKIGQLQKMEWLLLVDTGIGDDGLKTFGNLQNLELLILAECPIQGNGLTHISDLPKLYNLDLENCPIESQHLQALSSLPNLLSLNLSGTNIDDDALVHIAQIKSLKDLNLNGTAITDAGAQHLIGHPNLETINMKQTNVTEDSAPMLWKLPSITSLQFNTWGIHTGEGMQNRDKWDEETNIADKDQEE